MANIDCRECGKRKQKYQDCIGKEWYSWGDIRFCPHQVIWLFQRFGHRLLNISGRTTIGVSPWFNIPERPGDIDLPLHRAPLKPDAYFVDEVDVLAELEVRLEHLGRSAKVLVAEIGAGLEDGKASNIIIREFTQEAREAFHYITGVRRKRTPFYQWKSSRHFYYKNITKP